MGGPLSVRRGSNASNPAMVASVDAFLQQTRSGRQHSQPETNMIEVESEKDSLTVDRPEVQRQAAMPAWVRRALEEAQEWAAQASFAAAMRACLPVLTGPQRAIELLQKICDAWE